MASARSEFGAWLAGLVCTAVPCALVVASSDFDPLAFGALVALALVATLVVVVALRERRSAPVPSESELGRRCAWAVGAGIGVLVGVLAAQPTPTNWFMSDVAWHVAKVSLSAQGAPLQDPILRVATIYPFVFHLALAPFVGLGASPVDVLRWIAPLVFALLGWSYFRLQRALFEPRAAAWSTLALPLFLYAPTSGYAFLPNPFNASLPLVFLGLSALVRASNGAANRAERTAALGGLALGVAGLLWYGHLPWIVLTVLAHGLRRGRWMRAVIVGAAPCALVLIGHLSLLGRSSGTAIGGTDAPELMERLPGVGRNLLTLSGEAALEHAPWWIGPALVSVLLASWLRRREDAVAGERLVLLALAFATISLLVAGLRMAFWQPFSWRYGFLVFALALCFAGRARAWRWSSWTITPAALAALIAPWWAGDSVLRRLDVSRKSLALFDTGARQVAAYLREHTPRDEPVFASFDTWDLAIGCAEPRPNLVARRGGLYNFAPADFVAPRWRDYQDLLQLDDPSAAREKLTPYGFRLAVIAEKDLGERGFAALANGFENVLEAGNYRIVDLNRARK